MTRRNYMYYVGVSEGYVVASDLLFRPAYVRADHIPSVRRHGHNYAEGMLAGLVRAESDVTAAAVEMADDMAHND